MTVWVHAAFGVTGDRYELARFRKMMIKPRSEVEPEHLAPGREDLTLDFAGIIRPPEEIGPSFEMWAMQNWGVESNACDAMIRTHDPDSISFQFSTTCDFPTPVFEALAEEFPSLVLDGSAYEASGDWELVGTFNGSIPWGPGRIGWLDIDSDDDAAPTDAAPTSASELDGTCGGHGCVSAKFETDPRDGAHGEICAMSDGRMGRQLIGAPATGSEVSDEDLLGRLDRAAFAVGKAVVGHLQDMYPAALDAVTPNARRSLRNFVRNRVHDLTRPLIGHAVRVAAERASLHREIEVLQDRVAELEQAAADRGVSPAASASRA